MPLREACPKGGKRKRKWPAIWAAPCSSCLRSRRCITRQQPAVRTWTHVLEMRKLSEVAGMRVGMWVCRKLGTRSTQHAQRRLKSATTEERGVQAAYLKEVEWLGSRGCSARISQKLSPAVQLARPQAHKGAHGKPANPASRGMSRAARAWNSCARTWPGVSRPRCAASR